jgi:DNA-binding CsgD family transcriptional regulator
LRRAPGGVYSPFVVSSEDVTRLRTSELEALLAFVGEAYTADGPEPFTAELLDRLATLVPTDDVSFEEVDFGRRALLAKVSSTGSPWASLDGGPRPVPDGHWEEMNASPTAAHRRTVRDFGTLKWSDFLSRRERARYAEECEMFGVVDQASVWLAASLVHKISVVFTRGEGEFTERDRLVVDTLRPHLAGVYRAATVRRLFAAAVAGLEEGSELEGAGVILRRRDGGVEFVSRRARRLLDTYFDGRGDRLPPELSDWIETRSGAGSAFTVARPGRRLVVHALGHDRSPLLLSEEAAPSVPLTPREWDVMRCVAAGSSNSEIARLLWITPGTVRKHLENIYAKLGVHGRTAAVARLSPRLTAETLASAASK